MANTKVTQHVIADDAITTAMITDGNVTVAKLPSTVDLSSKTLTIPAITIPSASTATTQSQSDGSTKIATTAYVDTAITNLIDSAPGTLNTLNELAAALNDDANFNTTISNSVAAKLPLAGGTMTGNIAHASDLTLDLGGDLIVDVDGDNVFFDAAGTRFLSISQVSSDVYIGTEQNDKDLIFRGKDGSSTITALTLDMSEAGHATFNDGAVFGGTGAIRIPQGTTGQRPTAATGQIRWNTTDGALEVYNGSAWTAVGASTSNKILNTFTGDGSTTDFTLTVTPANEDALMVFIDGVYQEKGDYVLTNAVLALDTAPASGEKIACHITTATVHDGTSAVNQQFTATSGQTAFTLSSDPGSENNTQVYINGVYQQKTDYTVSGTTLTFDTGLTAGDVVEVNSFTVATLGNTDTVTEGSSNLYHTTARARSAISVSGNALSYNSSTGVISSSYEESPTFTGDITTNGVIKTGTSHNFAINTPNSLRINIDSNNSATDQVFVIGHNQEAVDNTNSVLMTILESGKVGIGQTNPSATLDVTSTIQNVLDLETTNSDGPLQTFINNGTVRGYIGNAEGAMGQGTSNFAIRAQGELIIGTNGNNERMRINSSGHVGIGTSSPSAPLDVVTNSTVYAAEFTQSNTSNGDGVLVQVGSTASADYALTVRSDAGNTSVLAAKADGKVGIGTFSPTVNLDVYNDSGWGGVDIDGTSGGELRLLKAGTMYGNLYASNTHGLVMNAANGLADIIFSSGGNTKMVIDNSDVQIKVGPATGVTHMKMNNGQMTMSDDATYDISGVPNTGALIAVSCRYAGASLVYCSALFYADYRSSTGITLLSDPSGAFAVSDTDGKNCLYMSSNATVRFKNRAGRSNYVAIAVIEMQGN